MNQFSIYKYENLSDALKSKYNRKLSQKLEILMNDINKDDVFDFSSVDEFVTSKGEVSNATSIVVDIFSKISAGIQAGSGNQILFNDILLAFTDSWEETNSR